MTSDAYSTIKRIKNNTNPLTKHEGVTYLCSKFGAMLCYTKDNRKGTWLPKRALEHIKKHANKNHHCSTAADKSCSKEEKNRGEAQSDMICAH